MTTVLRNPDDQTRIIEMACDPHTEKVHDLVPVISGRSPRDEGHVGRKGIWCRSTDKAEAQLVVRFSAWRNRKSSEIALLESLLHKWFDKPVQRRHGIKFREGFCRPARGIRYRPQHATNEIVLLCTRGWTSQSMADHNAFLASHSISVSF